MLVDPCPAKAAVTRANVRGQRRRRIGGKSTNAMRAATVASGADSHRSLWSAIIARDRAEHRSVSLARSCRGSWPTPCPSFEGRNDRTIAYCTALSGSASWRPSCSARVPTGKAIATSSRCPLPVPDRTDFAQQLVQLVRLVADFALRPLTMQMSFQICSRICSKSRRSWGASWVLRPD